MKKSPPTGATIDSETGKFAWTPSSSHGNSQGAKYTFDIVATKGRQEDIESITITVNDPISVPPQPKEPEPEKKFGFCGPGTKLIDGVCTIVQKPWWQF